MICNQYFCTRELTFIDYSYYYLKFYGFPYLIGSILERSAVATLFFHRLLWILHHLYSTQYSVSEMRPNLAQFPYGSFNFLLQNEVSNAFIRLISQSNYAIEMILLAFLNHCRIRAHISVISKVSTWTSTVLFFLPDIFTPIALVWILWRYPAYALDKWIHCRCTPNRLCSWGSESTRIIVWYTPQSLQNATHSHALAYLHSLLNCIQTHKRTYHVYLRFASRHANRFSTMRYHSIAVSHSTHTRSHVYSYARKWNDNCFQRQWAWNESICIFFLHL